MQKLFVLVLLLLLAPLANATTWYVNKDNACPGTGTTGDPYCTIQRAFNVAVAGDDIRIRKASVPYDEDAAAASSGTSGSPITVESDDPANQAIIRYTGSGATAAAIEVLDKAGYWTIQNLTFDGTGVFTSKFAVWVGCNAGCATRWAGGPDIAGIQILNNTFKNWGGTEAQESSNGTSSKSAALEVSGGYRPTSSSSYTITGTIVQGNTFDTDRLISLEMTSAKNSVIQNNEFKNGTCGLQGSGSGGTAVVVDGVHEISGTAGIGFGNLYKNNTFHDFQSPTSCGLTESGGYYEWDGIHCDGSPVNSTVNGNTIYNIDPTRVHAGASTGVHVEYACAGWTVENNIIYNIGDDGVLTNQRATGTRVLVTNNTIYDTLNSAIEVRYGYTTVENNILDNAKVQIAVRATAVTNGNWTVDYNDYWDSSGGTHVGWYNNGAIQENFATWKANCGCDSHSINANPLFVNPPSNFSLQLSSPARGAGLNGVDMGAIIAAPTGGAPTNLTATVH